MSKYKFDPKNYKNEFIEIVKRLVKAKKISLKTVDRILKDNPKDGNQIFSRDKLVAGIAFVAQNKLVSNFTNDDALRLINKVKLKPTRTISGVTTVTVLTKPFACPGRCVFCPNDVRMPKSYIATEPGAQRALMNRFSPYLQTYNRLQALKNIGHPTDKIELLVLGGTWSSYTESYKLWFIYECFRAMNDFGRNEKHTEDTIIKIEDYLKKDFNDELRKVTGDKPYNQLIQTKEFKDHFKDFVVNETTVSWEDLEKEHAENSSGNCRCVGLVLETRPDTITPKEAFNLRRLGVTKIQLGIQTLNDTVSELNKRGETKEHTAKSFELLRAAGFKIHAHIMPNLYGSNLQIDRQVYKELFESENYKPDEVKIYPTSIIKNTELYKYYEEGKYIPYTANELVNLVADLMETTPEYCRLTRIIRDIPSTEIEAGNKTTNLREVVEYKLKKENRNNPNIRAREIKDKKVSFEDLNLDIIEYKTKLSTEYFLQYITKTREIAGFLRLSIPNEKINSITEELNNCAIIREIHVYGPSIEFEKTKDGAAQHIGLGTKLIDKAKIIAKNVGYKNLAVISAIGTREYYQKRGFELNKLYQITKL